MPEAAASAQPTFEDRLVFDTDVVRVGAFRCDRNHPAFENTGPTENYCFVFPRTSVQIEHQHEHPFVANPTVVTFYNPAEEYRRREISASGDRSDWFGVGPAILREVLEICAPGIETSPERLFWVSHARVDPLTYFLQRQVFEHASSPTPVEPLAIEETALIVLERLIQQISARRRDTVVSAISPRHRDLAHDAEILLSARFQESLSLRTIARLLETSEYHLCRVFRRVTGRTLHRYRHDLRVRTSLERVVESRSTLTDVAIELGFSSHSHFTQAFRVEFGQRPSQFRQRHDEARRASQRLNEQA